MKKIKKLVAFLLLICIMSGSVITASAFHLITANDGSSPEHFTLTHNVSNGNVIKTDGGKLVFEFSPRSGGAQTRTSYIARQNLVIAENFCFDAFVRFSDASKASGTILLRNYNITDGFCNLITFAQGKMKFVTGGELDIPSDEFRFKIILNGNNVSFEINGSEVSSGTMRSSFSLMPMVELRAEFSDSLCSAGESHSVCMDNIKIIVDESSHGICADDAEFFVDYGRERIRKETVLDPFEELTAKIRVANLGNSPKPVMFIDRENIAIHAATLAPGEVTTLSLVLSDGSVSSLDSKDYLLWTDDGTITPLKPKQTIANDGVVVPSIADCKDMLSKLNGGNLWLTSEHIARMQSWLDDGSDTYDELFAKLWADIKAEGESLLSEQPVGYGNNLGVQPAAKIYYRIALWSTLWHVTHSDKYTDRIYEEMLSAASFPDWHDEHFLDTAAVLCGMAIGYDTLNGSDKSYDLKPIADAIYKMGLMPALSIYRTGTDTWDTRTTNWNVICNSAVAMAALALGAGNEYVADCAEAFNTAMRNLRIALSEFSDSGSWYEGVSYAGYLLTYAIDLFGMLTNVFGTNFGYDAMPNLLNYGYAAIALTGSYSYNHDDAPELESSSRGMGGSSPALSWFADKMGDLSLGKYHMNYLARSDISATFRDVILYNPAHNDGDITNLKNDFYDPDLMLASFRDNFSSNTFLAFNAGSNLSSHSHLDMGSFVYDWAGERWFEDLGTDSYDLWHYLDYNAYKWYYYRNRAEGHNCMVFDTGRFEGTPASAPDQVVEAKGAITKCVMGDDVSYAVMDLSSAYALDCSSYSRAIMLDKSSGAMAVRDSYDLTTNSVDAYWFAHTQVKDIVINKADNSAVLTQKVDGVDKKLYVKLVEGSGELSVMDALPLDTSPNPDTLSDNVSAGLSQNKNTAFKKLAVKTTVAQGSHGFFVVAIPYENKAQLNNIVAKFQNLR